MCIGYIYSIRSINNHQKQYIGSTVQPISTRLSKHVHDYKRYIDDRYNYVSSFEIIMNGNYEIVELERVNFIFKDDLKIREQFWFENLPCVNILSPRRKQKGNTVKFIKKYKFKKNILKDYLIK